MKSVNYLIVFSISLLSFFPQGVCTPNFEEGDWVYYRSKDNPNDGYWRIVLADGQEPDPDNSSNIVQLVKKKDVGFNSVWKKKVEQIVEQNPMSGDLINGLLRLNFGTGAPYLTNDNEPNSTSH
ncbi:uncharacterized protein LOC126835046 isoform X2 [Adelges cooleyi]|uniref:uncharacterized protein LOC126835046 isoform X2 n=1 Tax=Adelges cooleyi TaxID=133065 RepID=UPI00217FF0B0|nr:uncharacterized protein LOC126835046 isoform X2 [Adelges cooleyi]